MRDPHQRPLRQPIPLGRRPWDVVFIAFFVVNLGFITYVVDLEQLVIADPADFDYPVWPPPFLVDLVHWWGREFDLTRRHGYEVVPRTSAWRGTAASTAFFDGHVESFPQSQALRLRHCDVRYPYYDHLSPEIRGIDKWNPEKLLPY